MAETVKISKSRPSAATLTTLYTVPANTRFMGQLFIMNDTTAAIGARVAIEDGGTTGTDTYIMGGSANSASIPGDGHPITIKGICLGPADEIEVYSVTAGLVFNLIGVEIT